MNKPIVNYIGKPVGLKVGECCICFPIDHPSEYVSNKIAVTTSTVIRIGENGEFETRNTIYKPKEK